MSTLRVEALEQPDGTAFVFNNKNLLINGGMNIWQRSTSTSVSTQKYSTVDRFNTRVNSMGVFTISRSTDVPSAQGFGYSMKWDCTTADASPAAGDFIIMEQKIEGQNLQYLLKGTSSAKKLTLSFWVKSNKTGTYIASLHDQDNSRRISKSYTIDSASTWEKKEIVFEGDTTGTFDNDNNASLWVQWWLGSGSDHTSGTLATSWESETTANIAVGQVNLADSTSNELYITGCQLEVSSTASGFEFEPYATTERKCFRYAERISSQNENLTFFIRRNTSDNAFQGWYNFKEPKRGDATLVVQTQPALTTGTPTTNQFRMFNSSAWSYVTSTIAVSISGYGTSGQVGTYTTTDISRGMIIRVNVNSGSTGQLAGAEFQHADLVIDAEL